MKVRVYTDYSPVRILRGAKRDADDAMALKAGLSGSYIVKDHDDPILLDRANRDFLSPSGSDVAIDQTKKTAFENAKLQRKSRKQAILAKLGLEKNDIKKLKELLEDGNDD